MRACVDIGGTKVAVSLSADSASPLIGRRSEPTAKTGDNDAVAVQILRLIDEICAEQGIDARVDRRASACRRPVLSNCATAWSNSPRPTSAAASPAPRAACPTSG